MTTAVACDCGGKGLGLAGFHYEGAEGCLRPIAASSAVGETVKRRAALLRTDGASDVDAVTGALRSLTRAERAAWLGETTEELQKGDAWLREAAIRARDRMWARLVLAERAARAEERTGATVALRNFGVDVDASIAAAASATARTCAHEKVYSGERHPTGAPQWFWICAKCHGTGADSLATPAAIDFHAFVNLLGHIDPVGADNMRRMRGVVLYRMRDPIGEGNESELQKNDTRPREAAAKARDRLWARLALAEKSARAEECAEAIAALRDFGVDVASAFFGSDLESPEPPSGPLGDRT